MNKTEQIIEVLTKNFTPEEIDILMRGIAAEEEGISIHFFPKHETLTLLERLIVEPNSRISINALKKIEADWEIVFTEGIEALREKQQRDKEAEQARQQREREKREEKIKSILREVGIRG